MQGNDSSGPMAGAVLGLIVLYFIVKAMKKVFIEVGHMFDAFGDFLRSFVLGLWHFAEVAFFVSLGLGSVAVAIYFTHKYVRMVKRATEIQKGVRMDLDDCKTTVRSEVGALSEGVARTQDQLNRQIRLLEMRLEEALKAPEVKPEPQKPVSPATAAAPPTRPGGSRNCGHWRN